MESSPLGTPCTPDCIESGVTAVHPFFLVWGGPIMLFVFGGGRLRVCAKNRGSWSRQQAECPQTVSISQTDLQLNLTVATWLALATCLIRP